MSGCFLGHGGGAASSGERRGIDDWEKVEVGEAGHSEAQMEDVREQTSGTSAKVRRA